MSELTLKLIAENKLTKNPFLDLGNCGLAELPDELFDCVWLEGLNFGGIYFLKNLNSKQAGNQGRFNIFNDTNIKLSSLHNLKRINISHANLIDICAFLKSFYYAKFIIKKGEAFRLLLFNKIDFS